MSVGTVTTQERARQSLGHSDSAIYRRVAEIVRARHSGGGRLLDVGCGGGGLCAHVQSLVDDYEGVDALRYEAFPSDCPLHLADFDHLHVDLPAGHADIVAAVETIEHLENPRAFCRELARLVKRGGLIVVTTPNQLSWLSKMTLLFRNQFNAFQEGPGLYPAHQTALLECDLIRIANECGWQDVEIHYSGRGRIPGTPWHWPAWLGMRGRAFSDNILMSARRV